MSKYADFTYNFIGAAIFSGINFLLKLIFIRILSPQDYAVYGNIYNAFTTLSGFLITYPISIYILQNYQIKLKEKQINTFLLYAILFITLLLLITSITCYIYSNQICNWIFGNLNWNKNIQLGIPLLLSGLLEVIATCYIAATQFKSYAFFRGTLILQLVVIIWVKNVNDVFNSFTVTYITILLIYFLKYKHYYKDLSFKTSEFWETCKSIIKTSFLFFRATGFDFTIWCIVPLLLTKYTSLELSGLIIALSIFQQLLTFFIGFSSNFFYSNIAKCVANKNIKKTYLYIKSSIFYTILISSIIGFIFIINENKVINLFLGQQYNIPTVHYLFYLYICCMVIDIILNAIIGIVRIFKNVLKYLWIRTVISYLSFFSLFFILLKTQFNIKIFLICILVSNFLGVFCSYLFIKSKIAYHDIFYDA